MGCRSLPGNKISTLFQDSALKSTAFAPKTRRTSILNSAVTESRGARDQTHAEVPKEISDADRSQILNACEVEALEFADDADNRHLFGHL